jgi:hypothetical protein
MTKSGLAPSGAVLAEVDTMIATTYPKTITFKVESRAVVFHDINIRAVVWLAEGAKAATVRTAIQTNLDAYLAPMLANGGPNLSVGFGFDYKDSEGRPTGEIPWSHFFGIVENTAGVRKVGAGSTEFQLNGVRDDVVVPIWKFPRRGTLTIINGDTGGTL